MRDINSQRSIVPPKKDEPHNKGARSTKNSTHIDESMKVIVKNDQFGKKETKKKYAQPSQHDTYNRTFIIYECN